MPRIRVSLILWAMAFAFFLSLAVAFAAEAQEAEPVRDLQSKFCDQDIALGEWLEGSATIPLANGCY